METLIPGFIAFAVLLVLIMLRIPIAFALGIVSFFGITWVEGLQAAMGQFSSVAYGITSSFSFAVFPLFVLMGHLAAEANVGADLLVAARAWLGRVRGGLNIAMIVAAGAFGACSGSTAATSALFTRLMLRELVQTGYDKGFASGCIAAAGTVSALIPPSGLMVIYCMLTDVSLGQLMVAGILPGVMTIGIYVVTAVMLVGLKPSLVPKTTAERYTLVQKIKALGGVWGLLLLFFLLMSGIFFGWFPPSMGAAIGASGALFLGLARRKLGWRGLSHALFEAAITSSSVFIIIVFGTLLGRFLAYSGFVSGVQALVNVWSPPPSVVLGLFTLMYLILGCLIDPPSMVVITMPFVFPTLTALGYDPVWLGIYIVVMVEIAALTPPLGLNVFVVKASAPTDIPLTLDEVFKGIFPFVAANLVATILINIFPAIALWLPAVARG